METQIDLSFLITGNDFENICKSVDAIEKYTTRYTYEILVCSFEKIEYKNLIWVEDDVKQIGNTVQAYNKMYKCSKGDYIFVLNDDHIFPNARPLKVVEYLKSFFFNDHKYKVSSIGAQQVSRLCSTSILNAQVVAQEPNRLPAGYELSEELKDPRFYTYKHRYLIMGYPVFERVTVERYFGGYLFNPSFKHHYADNWLPFYIGETDDYPLICEDTSLVWTGKGGTTIINDGYDYEVFTKLVRNLLKNNGTYYDKV
jgi:hypothetical protein